MASYLFRGPRSGSWFLSLDITHSYNHPTHRGRRRIKDGCRSPSNSPILAINRIVISIMVPLAPSMVDILFKPSSSLDITHSCPSATTQESGGASRMGTVIRVKQSSRSSSRSLLLQPGLCSLQMPSSDIPGCFLSQLLNCTSGLHTTNNQL
jgi:hypothetical protein